MEELVILTDYDGKPIGTAKKSEVHTDNTPLHLAFSCYLFNKNSEFLLTRRALSKKVWPGWWTNSVCGHLMPGETTEQAIRRRVKFELGIGNIDKLEVVLPDYRYKTPPDNGIIENEICPVYVGVVEGSFTPNPDEVEEHKWVEWPEAEKMAAENPEVYSWWFKDQLSKLQSNKKFNEFLKQLGQIAKR